MESVRRTNRKSLGTAVALYVTAVACEFANGQANRCKPTWRNDLPSLNGPIRALAVCQGELYAGGDFLQGNLPLEFLYGVARLDWQPGSPPKWIPLGTTGHAGTDGYVNALVCFGGELWVGGSFGWVNKNLIGGQFGGAIKASNVARWSGTAWSPAHAGYESTKGTGDVVHVMTVDGGSLYVGGDFFSVGMPGEDAPNLTVWGIARYGTSGWSRLECGVAPSYGQYVRSLLGHDEMLYVGGYFDFAHDPPDPELGCPGSSYQPLCGAPEHGILSWNGSNWSFVLGGVRYFDVNCGCCGTPGCYQCGGGVNALEAFRIPGAEEPDLYVGGQFRLAGPEPNPMRVYNIVRLSAETGAWAGNGSGPGLNADATSPNASVNGLRTFPQGGGVHQSLFVGGDFDRIQPGQVVGDFPGTLASNLARWDGASWAAVTSVAGTNGTAGKVLAMVEFQFPGESVPSLIISGNFSSAGGLSVGKIARLTFEDGDGDGVPDSCDNCPDDDNPVHSEATDCNGDGDTDDPGERIGEQCDGDGDGVGDACDLCPCADDEFDLDGDGVAHGCDNCVDVANVNQADEDGNGIGDACQLSVALAPSHLFQIKNKAGVVVETIANNTDGQPSTRERLINGTPILSSVYAYTDDGDPDAPDLLNTISHQPLAARGKTRLA